MYALQLQNVKRDSVKKHDITALNKRMNAQEQREQREQREENIGKNNENKEKEEKEKKEEESYKKIEKNIEETDGTPIFQLPN